MRKKFSLSAPWNEVELSLTSVERNKHRRIFERKKKKKYFPPEGGVVNSMEISKSLPDSGVIVTTSKSIYLWSRCQLTIVYAYMFSYVSSASRSRSRPNSLACGSSPVEVERSRPNPSCQRIMKTFRRDETCISCILAPLSPPILRNRMYACTYVSIPLLLVAASH